MTTDLDLTLRDAGSHLHLDTPVVDVMERGARIRRGRQRLRVAGAGAVLAGTAGVLTIALPPGTGTIPAAQAGWGPAMVNLSAADLADADAMCRDQFGRDEWAVPAGLGPLAADTRGRATVLVYRFDDVANACVTHEGQSRTTFLASGLPWNEMIAPGHHFRYLTSTGTVPDSALEDIDPGLDSFDLAIHADLPVMDGIEVLRVSDDVARLVLHVAGQDFEARVDDRLAVSWVPQGVRQGDVWAATATAYDADGQELETGPLFDSPPPASD